MIINSFRVEKFRNLQDFTLDPCSGVNILYGNNAQGKTNLLEAMWLFTGSRSFRGAKEADYIQNNEEIAFLEMNFNSGKRDQISLVRFGKEKRVLELNGIKKNSFSEFAGNFCTVVFSPDHLSIIKEGPDLRRQMLDTALSQAYPKYSRAMDNYNKALKQRNRLLKDICCNSSLMDLLELWDKHISDYGGYISAIRNGYIKKLAFFATEIYNNISQGRESLEMFYMPSFEGDIASFDLQDFQNAIASKLMESRSVDLKFGTTSVGPHRDDLGFNINGMSARSFGSQGQQRSTILAIKLAECEILEEQNGEPPIIMLDDVMSELDKNRRDYLLNKLKGKQVFITCCDMSVFSNLEKGSVFNVDNGMLKISSLKEI